MDVRVVSTRAKLGPPAVPGPTRKREVGRGERLLPGVWRLRLPLPWPGVPHGNAWAVAAGSGVVLVDTGIGGARPPPQPQLRLGRGGPPPPHLRPGAFTHPPPPHPRPPGPTPHGPRRAGLGP